MPRSRGSNPQRDRKEKRMTKKYETQLIRNLDNVIDSMRRSADEHKGTAIEAHTLRYIAAIQWAATMAAVGRDYQPFDI